MQVLVLEDEPIIGFALEDMLLSLGCEQVRLATRISEAEEIVRDGKLDVAILDVNIHGSESYPVADALAERRVPYFFATGYGDLAHPVRHRCVPTVTKPYSVKDIEAALAAVTARD